MRCVGFVVLALGLIAGGSGCQAFHRRAAQGPGGYQCADGSCSIEGPYADDDCAACQVADRPACAGGACDRSHGMLQAIGRLFHHNRPEAPVGGPPVGTVTYPYYTVRGPRDFLANDPPSIGP